MVLCVTFINSFQTNPSIPCPDGRWNARGKDLPAFKASGSVAGYKNPVRVLNPDGEGRNS